MADHKRQHFVARCYLKPFSLDGDGVAINLCNIARGRSIQNAAMRGQCAKSYFYGEDLGLERIIKEFEDEYARVVRLLQDEAERPTVDDLARIIHALKGHSLASVA